MDATRYRVELEKWLEKLWQGINPVDGSEVVGEQTDRASLASGHPVHKKLA